MAAERPKREGVMLCYPLDQGRLNRLGNQFFVQPKINGERARLEWFGDEPVLLSSYNNPFSYLDHIKDALRGLYGSLGPIPLDGEIYVHGWTREQIDSALRRTVNKSDFNKHLEYHLFDIASQGDIQAMRIGMLLDIKNTYIMPSCLKVVETRLIDQSLLDDMCQIYLEEGYEGAILRNYHAFWTPKRSVGILKYKPTEIDEYIILKVHEATDKYGIPKGMVGGFSVKAPDLDESFKVGAGKLNHLKRTEIWRDRQSYIGRTLVVKHEKIRTTNGIPVCCVSVEVKMSDIHKIEEVFVKIFQFLAEKNSKVIASVDPFGDKYGHSDSVGGMIVHLRNGKSIKILLSFMP